MNTANRKEVSKLISELEDLQWKFENIQIRITDLADEEQEKFDNLSEGLQASEAGQIIETAAQELQSAAEADSIADTLDALVNVV